MTEKTTAGSKTTAVVPAYNEEKTISAVLKILSASSLLDDIIVVDDGSTDQTARVVRDNFPQVKLISKKKNKGKADALLTGAREAKNQILLFCDADLTDLKPTHLEELINPVIEGRVRMIVGAQEMMNVWKEKSLYQKLFYSSKKTTREKNAEMSDFVKGLGGEKVMFKEDFLAIPKMEGSDYGVEQKIIAHFKKNHLPFEYRILKGVGHVWKPKKWGWRKGFLKEAKAFTTFGRQYLESFFTQRTSPE